MELELDELEELELDDEEKLDELELDILDELDDDEMHVSPLAAQPQDSEDDELELDEELDDAIMRTPRPAG